MFEFLFWKLHRRVERSPRPDLDVRQVIATERQDGLEEIKNPATSKRLLTLPEAAHFLNCSIMTVRRLIWTGRLAYVRWDRRQRVDLRDLELFIIQNKRQEAE